MKHADSRQASSHAGSSEPIAAEAKPADTSSRLEFQHFAQPAIDAAMASAQALGTDDSAETLHRLRVSMRRLRSLLWAYKPLLDPAAVDQWRAAFKEVADAAGQTRNWDILIDTLLPRAGLSAAHSKILHDRATVWRAAALQQSRATIGAADVGALLANAFDTAGRTLAERPEGPAPEAFARGRFSQAHAVLQRRAGHVAKHAHKHADQRARQDLTALHHSRIAVKKLRYLGEFFEPALKQKSQRLLRRLAKLQTRLGDLNDLVVSRQMLDHWVPESADEAQALRALRRWLSKKIGRRATAARRRLRDYR